jgi:type I restriction enzyme M protein
MSNENHIKNNEAFIWSVADLLRGQYKPYEYQDVMLPLTVLRRLDCVLEGTKDAVLTKYDEIKNKFSDLDPFLKRESGQEFYNTSKLTMAKLLDDSSQIAANLRAYIAGFSSEARDILDKFDFDTQINKLDKANLLYLVIGKFVDIDLHPNKVSNLEMGYLYEELIRKFSELSNETAGEHFTPREVIKLMVNILFAEDTDMLTTPSATRSIFDPACGTGGMLSTAEEYIRQLNPTANAVVFGQEWNPKTYAVCRSDMMIKGQDASNITYGDSLTKDDGHAGKKFDYCLANPPFGVEWKVSEKDVKEEAERLGFKGRYGAGLPRINDGSFLFLQHMISKMKPVEEGGSRIAVVFNGSPLFTGAAGSGESEIRRWIIENDWLEAVVALPDNLFYNTGISTYFWIVTNRKSAERRGKVQLIDARDKFEKMRKALGEKRKEISDVQIAEITKLYSDFEDGPSVKIFSNESFGYLRITVERPLKVKAHFNEVAATALKKSKAWKNYQALHPETTFESLFDPSGGAFATLYALPPCSPDEWAKAIKATNLYSRDAEGDAGLAAVADEIIKVSVQSHPDGEKVTDKKGGQQADADLRDNENVPLPNKSLPWVFDVTDRLEEPEFRSAIDEYFANEVLPYVPDAWIDYDKTKIGYEIPLTRHFYKYVPPRPLAEIDAEIKQLEAEIQALLNEVAE